VRKWLAAVLLGSVIFSTGCMGGGGQQQPAQAPEPSDDQVEKAVKEALHDEDMKDFIQTQVRTQSGQVTMDLALETKEGQKAVSDSVKKVLSSSVGQTAIANQVGEMMDDPVFKSQMQSAIRQTLMEMMAKGTEDQKKKKEKGGEKGEKGEKGGEGGGG
jgi:hypothetical protein